MNQLQGKRAFITGSYQGIGLGIALALDQEGADIVLHGLADQPSIDIAVAAVKTDISPVLAPESAAS